MRNRNKFAGAVAASAVIASGMVALTAPAANAAAVNGGCATFFRTGTTGGVTDTTQAPSYLGSPKGAWSDEATTSVKPNYTLSSTGSSTVGGTRNFTLDYDKGMLSFAPATGAQHWFFSVNGTMLPAVVQSGISLAGGTVSPAGSVSGSFPISDVGSNEIVFERMVFEANEGVRVVCSGQEGSTPALNSHTTPVRTNVDTSFTAVGPTLELDFVKFAGTVPGNQAVNTYGRAGDIINVDTSVFSTTDPGTLELCDADGVTNCEGTGTVVGNGTGTLAIPAGATAGVRKLVATVGTEKARADFNVLGQATLSLGSNAGGVGTTVTVTGSNFDPNQVVTVQGLQNVLPLTGQPTNSADAPATFTASATGTIGGVANPASYTINDAATRSVSAAQPHRSPVPFNMGNLAGMTATTGTDVFLASANSCTAKVNAADTTGSCAVVQTLDLDVTAGALSMAQASGDIDMEAIQLNGTDQVSEGSINNIVVKDYRNGTLGWTLNATFSGMSGAGNIAPSALALVGAACTEGTNNDNTVVATSGAFVDAATAITVCGTDLAPAEISSGDTTASSDLELDVASDTAPGNYTGNLTFTLS